MKKVCLGSPQSTLYEPSLLRLAFSRLRRRNLFPGSSTSSKVHQSYDSSEEPQTGGPLQGLYIACVPEKVGSTPFDPKNAHPRICPCPQTCLGGVPQLPLAKTCCCCCGGIRLGSIVFVGAVVAVVAAVACVADAVTDNFYAVTKYKF